MKNKTKLFSALSGLALFIMGGLFALVVMTDFSRTAEPEKPEETEPVTTAEAGTVAAKNEGALEAGANEEWLVHFSMCDHTVETESGGTLTGMTREEIEKVYPEYKLAFFDIENVRLVREVEGCCPEHYHAVMSGGTLIISKMDMETLSMKELMRIIPGEGELDSETTATLEKGALFQSLSEINAYLESIE